MKLSKILLIILVFICEFSLATGNYDSAVAQYTTNNESLCVAQMQNLIESQDLVSASKLGEKSYTATRSGKVALYLGKTYYMLHKYDKAVIYFKKAAAKGEGLAMLTLGNIYGSGVGGYKSDTQAVNWYTQAVARGNVQAMNYLGLMYRDGLTGESANYPMALKLFNMATQKDSPEGYFNLAYMYQKGLGVMPDYQRAIALYTKAADLGNKFAMNNLGLIYNQGLGVKVDYLQSLSWYTKSAVLGDANAQCNVGIFYYEGDGIPKDYKRAKKWFKLAKSNGCKIADTYLKKINNQ
jgi:TPR repeat protein